MELVVNEWLPEYFKPDAKREEKDQLQQFLQTFIQSDDCIVVRRKSPFLDKIHRFSKDYQRYEEIKFIRIFIRLVLDNSKKCRYVDDTDVLPLSDTVTTRLHEFINDDTKTNYSSDEYLFEAANTTENKMIITTDAKLQKQMQGLGFEVCLLADFLKTYQK